MKVPNLSDEINRKTIETIEMYALKHSEDELTDGEFKIVAKTLWEATSGLASPDTTNMLADVAEQLVHDVKRRYFVTNENKVIKIVWRNFGTSFVVLTYEDGKLSGKPVHKECADNDHMLSVIDKFCRKLNSKGIEI